MTEADATREMTVNARELDRAFSEEETPTARSVFDFVGRELDPSRAAARPRSSRARSSVDWILPLDAVPFLGIARADLEWVDLSPAAIHLVLRLDGVSTMTRLLEGAGHSLRELVCELRDLVQQGIVRFRAA